MTRKIFQNSLLVGLSVFLLSAGLFFEMLYNHFNDQLTEQLENESWMVVQGMERMGGDYLQDISSSNRITWVDREGWILFDNQADVTSMPNHMEREEIRQAMETGSGSAERYSDTLAQKTFYVARRLQNGTVIRLASAQSTTFSLFLSVLEPVLFILLAAVLLSLLLAFRLTKQLVKPILELDLEHPEQCDAYEELQPLLTRLKENETVRREFTANVSHELKTPLTSISGMAEIIRSGFVKPEDIPGFAGDIYQESQRLIALIEDIIHLSRLDEGGLQMERAMVDMEQLVHEILYRLHTKAQEQKITLSVQGEGFSVSGVPAVLDEMLYNLCDNAVKYNRPGGRVTVTLKPDGCVTVSDTGIGIPAEDCERVFERFYRVDKSHSKEIGGTGLGLSIVKHGAVLHDATVELKSRVGEGTHITLRFPL